MRRSTKAATVLLGCKIITSSQGPRRARHGAAAGTYVRKQYEVKYRYLVDKKVSYLYQEIGISFLYRQNLLRKVP